MRVPSFMVSSRATVTDAFIAWFLALGFTAPGLVTLRNNSFPRWRWQTGAATLVAIAAIFLFVPALSHMLAEREIASHGPVGRPTENEHILAGGKRITGFLVAADEADSNTSVPTLPWSKFVEVIEMIRLQNEFGPFLNDLVGKTPFAFVTGVRLDARWQQLLYIAPLELIEQRDAWAWKLTLLPRQSNESPIFRRVLTAERMP
jgi:hypothetical protein